MNGKGLYKINFISCLYVCFYCFFLLALVGASVQAETYYIALDGDDSNPGSLQQPWRTITKANNTLQAGDTVLIRAGTYAEVIRPANSGTSNENRIICKHFVMVAFIIRTL